MRVDAPCGSQSHANSQPRRCDGAQPPPQHQHRRVRYHANHGLWALLVTAAILALGALPARVGAADTIAADPLDNTYSGQSYITPERFPCRSNFTCAHLSSLLRILA